MELKKHMLWSVAALYGDILHLNYRKYRSHNPNSSFFKHFLNVIAICVDIDVGNFVFIKFWQHWDAEIVMQLIPLNFSHNAEQGLKVSERNLINNKVKSVSCNLSLHYCWIEIVRDDYKRKTVTATTTTVATTTIKAATATITTIRATTIKYWGRCVVLYCTYMHPYVYRTCMYVCV